VALAMLFHIHDMTQALAGPRLRWFVGEPTQALAEFRLAMESNPGWTVPQTFVRGALTRPAMEMEGAIQQCQQMRAGVRQLFGQLAASRARPRAEWAARYREALTPGGGGAKNPLRVLGMTSRYTTVLQHSMMELQTAVRASGVEMEVAIEPDDQSLENPFLEKIAGFNPDLIVQLSRMRYENPLIPAGIPFLTWDQDNLPCMRTAQATESVKDGLTFVAGQGALQGYVYLGWPAESVVFCHLAAATHRFMPDFNCLAPLTNQIVRSRFPLEPLDRNRTSAGRSPVPVSVRVAKLLGASISATMNPCLIPSFFGNGVPEYPAIPSLGTTGFAGGFAIASRNAGSI